MLLRKEIRIDRRAAKEIGKFPSSAQAKAEGLLAVLARDGELTEPFGKKIGSNLFEIRVSHLGQWRLLYAYEKADFIIVLSAFHKKTQKTPKSELIKAEQRMKTYE
jgi:phage-related protein